MMLGITSDDFIFLYVGRLCPYTKADLVGLVDIFGKTFKGQIGVKLIVAGSGPDGAHETYPQEILSRSLALGVSDQVGVYLTPTTEERALLYSAANVFVSPANSYQESFGIAIIEAMSFGLPIIASDWNGYRDIVVNGLTGDLFPTSIKEPTSDLWLRSGLTPYATMLPEYTDTVSLDLDACGTLMSRYASDRSLCQELGRAGRARAAAEFTWNSAIERHVQSWRDALSLRRDSGLAGSPLFVPNTLAAFQGHATHSRTK
jgi:glycosyltransferase involved in cell wall biosynthesis